MVNHRLSTINHSIHGKLLHCQVAENPPVRPLSIVTDWLSSAMRFCARPCSHLTLPTHAYEADLVPLFAMLFLVFWYTYPSEKKTCEMGFWNSQNGMIKHVPNHSKPVDHLYFFKKNFFYPCDISSPRFQHPTKHRPISASPNGWDSLRSLRQSWQSDRPAGELWQDGARVAGENPFQVDHGVTICYKDAINMP